MVRVLWSPEVIALILATVSLLWQVQKDLSERRSRAPRISVTLVPTTIVQRDERPRAEFHVYVENLGREPATIRGVGLRLPDDSDLRDSRADVLDVPQVLSAGQRFSVGFLARDVADRVAESGHRESVSIKAFCRDANGVEYRSAAVMFDVARFGKFDAA